MKSLKIFIGIPNGDGEILRRQLVYALNSSVIVGSEEEADFVVTKKLTGSTTCDKGKFYAVISPQEIQDLPSNARRISPENPIIEIIEYLKKIKKFED